MTSKTEKRVKEFKIITIDDQYQLYIDKFNVILQYRKKEKKLIRGTPKQTDEGWKDLGYYYSIQKALWAYCQHTVREQQDIKNILETLGKLDNMFSTLLKQPKFKV